MYNTQFVFKVKKKMSTHWRTKMAKNSRTTARMNIVVDLDIYLKIKTSQINISQTVNEFLKALMINHETRNEDLEKLEQKTEELEQEIFSLQKEKGLIDSKLIILRDQETKVIKENMRKQADYTKGKKDAGVMDFD